VGTETAHVWGCEESGQGRLRLLTGRRGGQWNRVMRAAVLHDFTTIILNQHDVVVTGRAVCVTGRFRHCNSNGRYNKYGVKQGRVRIRQQTPA